MSSRPPIEGDGIRVNYFNFLMRTPGEVAPPLQVSIPDTIVFEHNCPRSWFYYDVENREIRKRAGRDLQAGTILAEFGGHQSPISTIATFTYLNHQVEAHHSSSGASGNAGAEHHHHHGDPNAVPEPTVTVLYLTKAALERLLVSSSNVKLEGLLQKHVMPCETNECIMQAVWGPKVCVVRRRMNRRSLTDRPRLLSEKHCTFDGPDHLSIEVSTAKDTVLEVTELCERMVGHVGRAVRMRPINMMLYFKLDAQRRPRLLWCSSLRLEGHRIPGPISSNFLSPELEGDSAMEGDEDLLGECAEAQGKLEKAIRQQGTSSSPARMRDSAVSAGRSFTIMEDLLQTAAADTSALKLPPQADAILSRMVLQWHEVQEGDAYRKVQQQQATARQMVEDALYAAMSTRQEALEPIDCVIRFPADLASYLGGESAVQELAKSTGLIVTRNGDLMSPAARPSNPSTPPLMIVLSMANEWIDRHFAAKLKVLLEASLAQLQWNAVTALLPTLS